MRLFLMTMFLLFGFSPSHAFDHNDRTSLSSELQRLAADLEAGRYADLAERRPPLLSFWDEVPTEVRYIDVDFNLDVTDIRTTQAGVDYAIIPTTTVFSLGLGQDATDTLWTFAFQETGRWFFYKLTNQMT